MHKSSLLRGCTPWLAVVVALTCTDELLAQATSANNTCANPAVAMDGLNDWDSQGATNTVGVACSAPQASSPEVWFEYTASCDGTVLMRSLGIDPDTTLQVFSGCGGGLPSGLLACNDDVSIQLADLSSGVEFTATTGTTYLVSVSGWGGAVNIGILDIVCGYETNNHTCATASPLVDGQNFLSTIGEDGMPGALGPAPSCLAGGTGLLDAWGAYTATCDGTVEIDVFGAAVFVQTFDVCGDPDVSCDGDGNVTRSVATGQTILIQVGTQWGGGPSIVSLETIAELDITCTPSMVFPNEDCATAEPLPTMLPISQMISTVGAAPGLIPSCGDVTSNDIWFSFSAPSDGQLSVNFFESFTETIAIYDNCGGNELDCVNVNQAVASVSAGQVVFIQIGGVDGETGTGTLDIDLIATTAPNDNCDGAELLTDAVTVAVDTTTGVLGRNPSCIIGPTVDLWYEIVAQCDGELVVALANQTYDSALTVYDGCGGAEIECMDLILGQNETIIIPAVLGTTYQIQVGGFAGASGTVDLTATCEVPSNASDTCATAVAAALGSNPYTTVGASESGDDPGCQATDLRDTWLSYQSPTDAIVTFTEDGTGGTIALWDGCGGAVLDCGGPTVQVTMTAGQTVFIQVGNQINTTGAGTVDIVEIIPPDNDECIDADPVIDGPNAVTNVDASTSGPDPACGPFDPIPAPNDTWYTYTATCTGLLSASTVGSGFDTRLAAYSDCAGVASLLICDDDSGGNGEAEFSIPVTMGDTIVLQFFGFGATTGAGILSITCAPPLANDECANADPLLDDGMPLLFDATSAQDEGNAPACAGGAINDAWYEVVPSNDGVMQITGLLGADAIILAAYDSCGGNLLDCVGGFAAGGTMTIPATSGVPILVQIGSISGDTGELTATLFDDDLTGQVVIVNADGGGAIDSPAAIEAALVAAGADPLTQIATIPSAALIVGTPLAVFNCRGSFPDTTAITNLEGQALNDLVQAGVPVYTEGGDVWGFDPPTPFNEVDGIDDTVGAAEDGDDTHTGMTGADIFSGELAGYAQDQVAGDDFTDQLRPADGVAGAADTLGADAVVIWSDDGSGGSLVPYDTGIRYTTPAPNGNVISVSSEFGGWYQADPLPQATNMGLILSYFGVTFGPPPMGPEFIRGDIDQNGTPTIADAIGLLGVLFVPTAPVPNCSDTADVNGDGGLTLGDVIGLLSFLFQGGAPPAPPTFPNCGAAPAGSPTVGCAANNANCP